MIELDAIRSQARSKFDGDLQNIMHYIARLESDRDSMIVIVDNEIREHHKVTEELRDLKRKVEEFKEWCELQNGKERAIYSNTPLKHFQKIFEDSEATCLA